MAEIAVLGATVGFILAVGKDVLELHEKLKAITDIKGKMKALETLSKIIDCKVIQEIESRPFISDDGKDLLKKLKYLVYDMEDAVDYYDTKVLQKQRSKTLLRPVRYFFSSDNPIVFNITVGGMIKAITKDLNSILGHNSVRRDFTQNMTQYINSMPERRLYEATHSRNSSDVIGRETEQNMIANMLTDDSHGVVKIITIVGMGGLGKTTLAQLVFNDEGVKSHFESSRMWTYVGDEFDPAKIMKSVLEQATNNPSINFSEMDSLIKNLEKELSMKKFLLVLDNVWNEDSDKWDRLKPALTCGLRGSKILVTTRSQQVSEMMRSFCSHPIKQLSFYSHPIKQLSPADCSLLFQKFAFGNKEVDQTLMEIGEKIVKKSGGVPLAAICLGSMLHDTDEIYWSTVLKSEIWQLGSMEEKLLAVLKSSYETLSPRSKKCFAFASQFLKNSTMKKDELIKLWIANGFVRPKENFEAETEGSCVFNDLVSRSFFLLAPSCDFEDDSHVIKCTMHDLMHDLARSVSADVYWNSNQNSVKDTGNRTYHLQMHLREESIMTQVLANKPLYLRTFMSLYTLSRLSISLLKVFSEMKFLRALNLTHSGIREVPKSIGNLIHLRYLNLSWNNIEVLPNSITLLLNLQYFNLSFNRELRKLPKNLGNMQSLRELDLRSSVFGFDFRLTHMPCGLSRLINLRSLPLFIAGDKGTCSITELENLQLRGKMTIKFSPDFTNYSCGGKKILENKFFNELCIKFNRSEGYDKDMLNDLLPNSRLKKLSIWRYGSPQFPTWLKELQLPHLIEVNLCCDCEHIPKFGNLQSLKKLCLQSMTKITQMGADFHGDKGFPALQELFLTSMDNLEEWSEFHGVDELFPSLQRLKISRCPTLKCMPRFPRIQYLEISDCSVPLLSYVGRLTSLSVLRAMDMHSMIFFPSGCIRNLTSLKELQIIECRQLQSLPWDEMQHLHSLIIRDCPRITLQPEELVQIVNSVPELQICCRQVNLDGQLQCLRRLKGLSLCGAHEESFTFKYIHGDKIPKLHICCCDKLELLMTAEVASSTVLEELYIDGIINFTTLPDWLRHLKSLRLLSIRNCPELEMVPPYLQNLRMLEDLRIVNCPQLKSRCTRETGEDWWIISHVPHLIL